MASGAAALALKAAVVTAVLAVLVLPSLGRCLSLGPEPAAAPAPAPGPPISCNNCFSHCDSPCMDYIKAKCGENCEKSDHCAFCTNAMMKQCQVDCCSNGACGTCKCDRNTIQAGPCYDTCFQRDCWNCRMYAAKECRIGCYNECRATCV